MAENKTKPTNVAAVDFIAAVPDPVRRADAEVLREMMERLSGEPATMWGPSIIGFGSCHYKYESGREGDMPRIGFSPRKAEQVLYLSTDYPRHAELMARLGKHKTSKACLYVRKLADVDLAVLEEMMVESLTASDAKYPR